MVEIIAYFLCIIGRVHGNECCVCFDAMDDGSVFEKAELF